jgi:hypothetical protein
MVDLLYCRLSELSNSREMRGWMLEVVGDCSPVPYGEGSIDLAM